MSDYTQYTQWKQREESLPHELEQARVIAERVADDRAARRSTRRKAWRALKIVAAFHGFRRARRRSPEPGPSNAVAEPESELASR